MQQHQQTLETILQEIEEQMDSNLLESSAVELQEQPLSEELESILSVCPYCKRKHGRAQKPAEQFDNPQHHEAMDILIEAWDILAETSSKDWVPGMLKDVNTGKCCALGHYNERKFGNAYHMREAFHVVNQAIAYLAQATGVGSATLSGRSAHTALGQPIPAIASKFANKRWAANSMVWRIDAVNDRQGGRGKSLVNSLKKTMAKLIPASFRVSRKVEKSLSKSEKDRVLAVLDRVIAMGCPWNPEHNKQGK